MTRCSVNPKLLEERNALPSYSFKIGLYIIRLSAGKIPNRLDVFLVASIPHMVINNTLLAVLFDLLPEPAMHLGRLPRLDPRVKHEINLLERSFCCLRVHEEDVEGHYSTENTEDDVCPPLNVRESRSDKVCEGKVEYPVSSCGQTDTLGAVLEGEDLGGINPGSGGLSCGLSVPATNIHTKHGRRKQLTQVRP
jgi:hypothetical protein